MRDVTKMTEEQRGRHYYASFLTNLIFVIADIEEGLLVDCEEANLKAGYALRQDTKRYFKAALHNLTALRSETRKLKVETQEDFGSDCDVLRDLIYAAVTRTGTDNMILHRFYDYIMSFPDRVGLNRYYNGGESFKAQYQLMQEREAARTDEQKLAEWEAAIEKGEKSLKALRGDVERLKEEMERTNKD